MAVATGRRWLTQLTPGPLVAALRLPVDGSVQHLRFAWTDADAGRVRVREPAITAMPAYDRVHSEATSSDGTTVARLEIIVRYDDVHPEATSGVPNRPSPPSGACSRRFIVRPEQVDRHLEQVRSTLETAPARAMRDGGMPLPVVPTTLLVEIAADSALQRSAGEIEAWFMAPVPVGALVSARDHPPDGVMELRLPGRDETAVIVRATSTAAR